jgi:uncharacterized protein (DUF1015 family)
MTSAHDLERPLVQSVSGHIVSPRWAARVVSPLHDVLSEEERRAMLAQNPDSYLHVTSDPSALPDPAGDMDGDVDGEPVQARALRRLLERRAYSPVREPALFVYRLTDQGRDHTGVIANVAVEGFGDGRVLGHERVQPERVEALVRHYERVSMRSELVALFHPHDPVVGELIARVVAGSPILHFTDASGVTQSVWKAGPADAEALTRRLGGQRWYVADGHHRVAAATRFRERGGRPLSDTVLCALYPEDDVVLHAFHRRVRGPVDVPSLMERLAESFEVTPVGEPVAEPEPGSVGLHADGRWWVLRPLLRRDQQGVAGLDVTMVEEHVLQRLLGVHHGDPRLEYVPDLRDLDATVGRCRADGGVLFTLHAPRVEDVIAVAERGEAMSPKTTYVQPKPRTGIFLS